MPDELFPADAPPRLGYPHFVHQGMKGYNAVAILSRIPLARHGTAPDWCGRGDSRHVAVLLDLPTGPLELHDFYIPAGGDIAGSRREPEIRPQAGLPGRSHRLVRHPPSASPARSSSATSTSPRWSTTVWSHRQLLDVVSHTPGRNHRPARLAANRLPRRPAPLRPRPTKNSTLGGPTATATGAPPIAAAASTMSGSPPTSPPACGLPHHPERRPRLAADQ